MEPRTYEIVWADGRRERIQSTRIETGMDSVTFWGPIGHPEGLGQAGRLLMSVALGPRAAVTVRDVDAETTVVRPRWRTRPLGKRRR